VCFRGLGVVWWLSVCGMGVVCIYKVTFGGGCIFIVSVVVVWPGPGCCVASYDGFVIS